MRVLHLDGGHVWAGGQNQVRLLMRELARRGVAQACGCPRNSPLAARLRSEGLPVIEIPWQFGMDPRALLALTRIIGDFDIVHCHDAHALQLAWLPCRLRRRRLIAARRVHFKTSALKWNVADAVIAISGVVEEKLIESGVDARRIQRIPSGVDVAEVRSLPTLDLGLQGFRIASIGRLAEYKGQTIVPRAAVGVSGIQWAVIGDGPLRAQIERDVELLNVQDRVKLLGTIDDARRVLRAIDLFVFPSPDEPLGSSLFDAMAAGVPIVAARAAGAAEILGPVDAITKSSLFEPDNAEELSKLIIRVKADAGLRRRMVSAQDERLNDFTIEKTAEQTMQLYARLAGTAEAMATSPPFPPHRL